MAAIAGSVPTFRLMLMGWNLINVALVWKMLERFEVGKKIQFAMTLLFGVFSSIPLTEGNIANGEVFMIMPATLGAWLLWEAGRKNGVKFKTVPGLAGLAMAAAFLFKVPVLFEVLALGFWWTIYQAKNIRAAIEKLLSPEVLVMAGAFLIPILGSVAYYYAVGAGEPYVRSALMQNIGYLSSWEGGDRPLWENGLVQRAIVWLLVLGAFIWQRKKLGEKFGLAGLWLSGALFGALLSGRPYPHYLIEIVAPICLVFGTALAAKKTATTAMAVVLSILVVLGIKQYDFWYYQSLPYYRNFIEYRLGRKDVGGYLNFFGDEVMRNFKTAEYIKKRTLPEDRIFVWGTEPAIYAMSERLPAGRYTVAYHVADFNGYKETMEAIEKEKPVYIVRMENERIKFEELDEYLATEYVRVNQIAEAVIYRKTAW